MSKRRVVSPRCQLAGLLLNPCPLAGLDGGAAAVLKQDARTGALRALTERRTDFSFLAGLADVFAADGFSGSEAWDAVAATVNNPAVVLRRAGDGGGADVLQAIAVEGRTQQRRVAVVTAHVTRSKPPEVRSPHAWALPYDWRTDDGIRRIAQDMEEWRREYRFGAGAGDRDQREHVCAWLGDPVTAGYRDVPPNWEERVRSVGAVLGLHTLIARSPADARAQALEQRIHLAVMVNGARGAWARLPAEVLQRWAPEPLGRPGGPFSDLLTAVRTFLTDDLLLRMTEREAKPRAIGPGEIVYHRKTSPQPTGYDRFDEGRAEPCAHGAESFRRWSGEKSLKGMARVYSNFVPEMLYHCARFPNCGVYSVRG